MTAAIGDPPSLRSALLTSITFLLLLPTLSLRLSEAPPLLAWLVFVVVAGALSVGQWQRRRLYRGFLVNHHVLPHSRWFRWLRGGVLLWPGAVLRGTGLAAALLAGLLASDAVWGLMVVAPLLLYVLRRLTHRLFLDALQPDALWLWSERIAGRLVLGVLLALHVALVLWVPRPDLSDMALRDAVVRGLYDTSARSELVSVLHAAGELPTLLFQWSLQSLIADTENRWWLLAGWMAILLKGALVYLPVVELSLGPDRWRRRIV
ncbi:MAG: hypothetical protein ACQETO_09790 [Pseudomonadota bacterium]